MFSIGFPKWVYDVVQKAPDPPKPETVTSKPTMNIIKVRSRHHKHISVTLAGGQHTIFFNREGIAECSEAVREALFTEMKFRPNRFEIISDTPIPTSVPEPTPVPAVFAAPPAIEVTPDLPEATQDSSVFDDIVALEESAVEPVVVAPLVDVPPAQPPTAKKRGRPPGSKNLPAPAKKKRGRPPKAKKS